MRSTGIHHLDLVVTSIERSLPFYLELLRSLGWTNVEEVEGERGETIWYVSGPGTTIGLREKQSDVNPVPYARYGVGVHHVCFETDTREAVDERADWLRAQGATIESGPKDYWYSPGYYAVFFYDPDGIKLEIAYIPE
jgi:catechol 2,3-dioxygenase-like lactoylglutathione lyase family enzyme